MITNNKQQVNEGVRRAATFSAAALSVAYFWSTMHTIRTAVPTFVEQKWFSTYVLLRAQVLHLVQGRAATGKKRILTIFVVSCNHQFLIRHPTEFICPYDCQHYQRIAVSGPVLRSDLRREGAKMLLLPNVPGGATTNLLT